MTGAIFRVMLLGLLRDRGAMVMILLLPAAFMLIFAQIFITSSTGRLALRVALVDETPDAHSVRLLAGLRAESGMRYLHYPDIAAARDAVIRGDVDVALALPADAPSLEEFNELRPPPFLIFKDSSREVAEVMLRGAVREAYFRSLPDLALKNLVRTIEEQFFSLTEEQSLSLDEGLADLRAESEQGSGSWSPGTFFETRDVVSGRGDVNLVSYSAAAVAILFLLMAAAQGSVSILDDLEQGIVDRLAVGPGNMMALLNGKFVYLTAQGLAQAGIIFLLAWLVYGVNFLGHWSAWLVVTLAASLAAAGISLGVACACRTRRQALAILHTSVLILSALGGSMIPRFLMPEEFRALGWITPNAWVIDAYTQVLWHERSLPSLWRNLLALLGMAGVSWALAQLLLARRLRA